MKILMLNYEYPPVGGGGAPVTAQLCEHLVGLGHPTDVITMRYKNLPHAEVLNGVRIFRTPSYRARPNICHTPEMATYLLGGWKQAAALARQNRYDIIHAHFIIPTSPLAWYLRRCTGIPYLVTCHGSDVPGYNPDRFGVLHRLLLPVWKKVVGTADALVSPSQHLKALMLSHCPELDIAVIPNGCQPTSFNTTRPRKNNILLCSRLFRRKGFQYVIEAVKDLTLDWQVHIIGDGPYLNALKTMAQDSKTPIIFHGWLDRDDPAFYELYETSSLFVFPSEMENFPTVLLEAMSAGLAIITSTSGGCPEVVGDAALLIPPCDTVAMRKTLLHLIDNEPLRRQLSGQAIQHIKYFSWKVVAEQYVDFYHKLTDRP